MCGRYSLFGIKSLKERYDAYNNPKFTPSDNVRPGTLNPVIVTKSPKSIKMMRWGLSPGWKDQKFSSDIINARSEGIQNKPTFKNLISKNRCLVPATAFYEWQRLNLEGKEEKIPWIIKVAGEEIFSMAGIYEIREEKMSYCIITTSPNSLVSKIHSRMPVIIKRKDEENYINPETNLTRILKLLVPLNPKLMESRLI